MTAAEYADRCNVMSIDYSKWDKLDVSDDECDRDDDDDHLPGVTRLDHPSSVVIGPKGVSVVNTAPTATASPFGFQPEARQADSVAPAGASLAIASSANDCQAEEDAMMLSSLTRNGLRLRNGGHMWGQTKTTVTIAFPVPVETKSRDVSGFGISDDERTLTFAVRNTSGHSLDEVKKFVLELRYPVNTSDDALAGCWQLVSLPSRSLRLLVFSFEKKSFGFASALWWERALSTDEELVDTSALEDRKLDAAKAQQVQNAWSEAQKEFVQSRKNKKVTTGTT